MTTNDELPVIEIDGDAFDDMYGFYEELGRKWLFDEPWGRNFNALNDVLRGGFGEPDVPVRFRWKNSARSREMLGLARTIERIESTLDVQDEEKADRLRAWIERARRGEEESAFEIVVRIFRDHESEGVVLELL
ncbi:MAG TPA: barstar family protein [Polyangiaceae bacterium]